MFLVILVPIILFIGLVGVLSMMFEDPDRVASKYSPFVDIND